MPQKRIRLGTMRPRVPSLASLSGLKIQNCHELWHRLQTRLGFCIAVALAWASSYSSDKTPSLGISMCHRCGRKKDKKTKKTKKKKKVQVIYLDIICNLGIFCLVKVKFALPRKHLISKSVM